ncbi:type II secretion system protein [Domibacillus indicus]|uniref:type II secretion system protein n=1 Tax=Domibacillus indicus TaxID=1437523 RepID=UPI0012E02D6F|nr:type II secretion system protein [Domibacillus indicus]
MALKKLWNLTARLKARICDERGVSLMELLAVIAIMAIIGSVLTSTLVTGQKIFTKQTAETQFREDADYVTTRIMNEFYSTPFDEVKDCGDGSCVVILNNKKVGFDKIENENEGSESTPEFYYAPSQKEMDSEKTETKIFIEGSQIKIERSGTNENDGVETLEVPSQFIPNPDNKPVFNVACDTKTEENGSSVCQSGSIELIFNLKSDRTVDTMQLESRFGF